MSSNLAETKSIGVTLDNMSDQQRKKLASKLIDGIVRYDCQRQDLSEGDADFAMGQFKTFDKRNIQIGMLAVAYIQLSNTI